MPDHVVSTVNCQVASSFVSSLTIRTFPSWSLKARCLPLSEGCVGMSAGHSGWILIGYKKVQVKANDTDNLESEWSDTHIVQVSIH
jgi:hypothetical protein